MFKEFNVKFENVEMIGGSDNLLENTRVTKVISKGDNKMSSLDSTLKNCSELDTIDGELDLNGVSDIDNLLQDTELVKSISLKNINNENISANNSFPHIEEINIGGEVYDKRAIQNVISSREWTFDNITYSSTVGDNVVTKEVNIVDNNNATIKDTLEQKAKSIEVSGQTYINLIDGKGEATLIDELSIESIEGEPNEFNPHLEQEVCVEVVEGQTYQNLVNGKDEQVLIDEFAYTVNDFNNTEFNPPREQEVCVEVIEGETYQNLVEGSGEHKLTDTFSSTWTESNNSIDNAPSMIEIPEIWGNTIQGYANVLTPQAISDHWERTNWITNATIVNKYTINASTSAHSNTLNDVVANDTSLAIQLNANTTYTLKIECPFLGSSSYIKGVNEDGSIVSLVNLTNATGCKIEKFTTTSTGKITFGVRPDSTSSSKDMKVFCVEGDVDLSLYDFGEFDLEYIQSVGDLYVDENNEPILDEEGNEQYKLEIESKNTLFDEKYLMEGYKKELYNGRYVYHATGSTIDNGLFVYDKYKFKENTQYHIKFEAENINNLSWGFLIVQYTDGINESASLINGKVIFVSRENRTIKMIGCSVENRYNPIYIYADSIIISETENDDDLIKTDKTTILLPQPLRRVVNAKNNGSVPIMDELVYENGKYYIKQRIDVLDLTSYTKTQDSTASVSGRKRINLTIDKIYTQDRLDPININLRAICTGFAWGNAYFSQTDCVEYSSGGGAIQFNVSSDTTGTQLLERLKQSNAKFYIPLGGSTYTDNTWSHPYNLIETKILEKSSLETYSPKTYISTNSEIQPSQMTVTNKKNIFIPLSLGANKDYTLQLDSIGKDDKPITVNLGGTETTVQPINDANKHHKVVVRTPATLTTETLELSGEGVVVNDIMLFEGGSNEIKQEVEYVDGVESIGELEVTENLVDHNVIKNFTYSTSTQSIYTDENTITFDYDKGINLATWVTINNSFKKNLDVNKKYTIFVSVIENTTTGSQEDYFGIYLTTPNSGLATTILSYNKKIDVGTMAFTFSFASGTNTGNSIRFKLAGKNSSSEITKTGKLVISKNIMLFEGDYTNKPIPPFVEDKLEQYKIDILTTNNFTPLFFEGKNYGLTTGEGASITFSDNINIASKSGNALITPNITLKPNQCLKAKIIYASGGANHSVQWKLNGSGAAFVNTNAGAIANEVSANGSCTLIMKNTNSIDIVGKVRMQFNYGNFTISEVYICDSESAILGHSDQSILLPQPLRKIGDIKDRLYWDEDKEHYCIEQNIKALTYKYDTSHNIAHYSTNDYNYIIHIQLPMEKDFELRSGLNWMYSKTSICDKLYSTPIGYPTTYESKPILQANLTNIWTTRNGIRFVIPKDKLSSLTVEGAKEFLSNFGEFTIYYVLHNDYVKTIDLPHLNKKFTLDMYTDVTHIDYSNLNLKPSVLELESPIAKYRYKGLTPSKTYNIQLDAKGEGDIKVDLGGVSKVVPVSEEYSRKNITITTSSTLSNDKLAISNYGNSVKNVMLFDEVINQEPQYIEGIQNIGEFVKNLFPIDAIENIKTNYDEYKNNYYKKEIQLQPNTTYSVRYLGKGRGFGYGLVIGGKENITGSHSWLCDMNINSGITTKTFTTDSTGKLTFGVSFIGIDSISSFLRQETKLQLEIGGNVSSEYFEGEKYKINILTNSGKHNLFDNNNVTMSGADAISNIFIEVNEGDTYTSFNDSKDGWMKFITYNSDKVQVSGALGNIQSDVCTITVPKGIKYIKPVFSSMARTNPMTVKGTTRWDYIPYTPYYETKQSILLPQPLNKIGDIKDRFYWDEDKGYYCIEQNIGIINDFSNIDFVADNYKDKTIGFYSRNIVADNIAGNGFTNMHTQVSTWGEYSNADAMVCLVSEKKIFFRIDKSKLETVDSNGVKKFLKENDVKLYVHINLNIIDLPHLNKKYSLDTYMPTTYLECSNNPMQPSRLLLESDLTRYKPTSLETNTDYTVQFECKEKSDKKIKLNLGGSEKEVDAIVGLNHISITTPSEIDVDIYKDRLFLSGVGNKVDNVMIVKGEMSQYPNYFEGVQSVGELQEDGSYKIDIETNNGGIENLFDINNFIVNSNNRGELVVSKEDNTITSNYTDWHYTIETNIDLEAGKKYLINLDFETEISGSTYNLIMLGEQGYNINEFNSSDFKNVISHRALGEENLKKSFSIIYTPTESKRVYLGLSTGIRNSGSIKLKNIQITEYNDNLNMDIPLISNNISFTLTQPLMKIGDVADRLCWDKGKKCYCVEQNLGCISPTENDIVDSLFNLDGYYTFAIKINNVKANNLIQYNSYGIGVTEYGSLGGKDYEFISFGNEPSMSKVCAIIRIKNERASNKTELLDYLKANNFTLIYKLATPNIIDLTDVEGDVVDLPRLYQREDTNLMVETGNIKPSKIKIEYNDLD